MRTRLPTGIQTFRTLREGGYHYVDKTPWALRMAEEGSHYFLSRPRRFGKSLFLDTLKELFEGSRELFEGLAIDAHWDWSERHPVLRLSFGSGDFSEPGRASVSVMAQLASAARRAGVASTHATAPERLADLLETLHEHTGRRVVVLVDEYDKPILDALETPELAGANRDFLRGLYATIKDCDAHVRFVFLTGVSRFSKVSVFSGLNNLKDVTLDPRYSAVCGYTEADLDKVFGAEVAGLDRARIREWYNGYNWLGEERMYNPYDVLLLLDAREFKAWWFETGTPTFLVRTLLRHGVPSPNLDGLTATDELLNAFDVEHIAPEALLFQTGYLTIVEQRKQSGQVYYRLGYPNREVRQGLSESLLRLLVQDPLQGTNSLRLCDLLEANDFAGLKDLFHAFYAGIPYEWHTNNEIARFEGYYASVFYSYFAGAGLDVTVEDSGSRGRLDMAVRFSGNVYLFEFKVVERAGEGAALAQLRERGYADKYRHLGEPIHLVGVEFSAADRNLAAFGVESA